MCKKQIVVVATVTAMRYNLYLTSINMDIAVVCNFTIMI
jgi:hypothetical protein